jgi:hypothetical protein
VIASPSKHPNTLSIRKLGARKRAIAIAIVDAQRMDEREAANT